MQPRSRLPIFAAYQPIHLRIGKGAGTLSTNQGDISLALEIAGNKQLLDN